MNVRAALAEASTRIARRDAERLLAHALGWPRARLLAHPEAELAGELLERFVSDVDRREQHWPVQYLTGLQEFFGLEFQVTPDVLIPRPETELLVQAVLAWVAVQRLETARIVDVGTGSGAIALALASRLPLAEITALDLSPAVQAVVERNAEGLGLAGRVRFFVSDLLRAVDGEVQVGRRFDVVVSNPPYVPEADAPDLQPEVRNFEPHLALFAGADGLEVYRRLLPEAWQALRPGGLLALEFGFGQREALRELLAGWDDVQFLDDYAGIPRIALAVRSPGRA